MAPRAPLRTIACPTLTRLLCRTLQDFLGPASIRTLGLALALCGLLHPASGSMTTYNGEAYMPWDASGETCSLMDAVDVFDESLE